MQAIRSSSNPLTMSILAPRTARLLRCGIPSARSLAPLVSARTFHRSSPRPAMSEDDHHKRELKPSAPDAALRVSLEGCLTKGKRAMDANVCACADEGDRKAEIDAHKNDSLGKQKDGRPEWKHQLASSSEAAVRDLCSLHSSFAPIRVHASTSRKQARRRLEGLEDLLLTASL